MNVSIATSAAGLLIYQVNNTPGFYYYSNKALWTPVSQKPGWSLTGNAGISVNNYLGTSDKKNLTIRTNNIERAVIDNLGNIGIGIVTPQSKLEVHNGALTISSTSTASANMIINANASDIGNSNQILFADNGITRWALGGSNIGSAGTNNFSLYNYNTSSNAITILNSSNHVGIGTTSPENKLHVSAGSSAATGYPLAPLVIENSSHSYINLLAPDAYETGILFGKPQGNSSGGVIYNNSGSSNGFQFRTNGNITKMVLTDAGSLGVGTTNPGSYALKISGSMGLDIEDASTNGDWELRSFYNDLFYGSELHLYWNGNFKGSFEANGEGVYTHVSDERLKTNKKPMGSMLERINQLKPCTYQFKNTTGKQEYNGFIAQDVMQIFPDLVMHTVSDVPKTDAFSLNYDGFGVIAIKGLQELLSIYTEQNKKITLLKKKTDELEKAITKLQANKKHTSISN